MRWRVKRVLECGEGGGAGEDVVVDAAVGVLKLATGWGFRLRWRRYGMVEMVVRPPPPQVVCGEGVVHRWVKPKAGGRGRGSFGALQARTGLMTAVDKRQYTGRRGGGDAKVDGVDTAVVQRYDCYIVNYMNVTFRDRRIGPVGGRTADGATR
jgi:hypothetical protein